MRNNYKQSRIAVFSNVQAGKDFFASNGLVIKNLYDLASAFESMDEYTFSQHVNEQKNDFASWTREVLGQHQLASQLNESKTLHQHHVETLKQIVTLLK